MRFFAKSAASPPTTAPEQETEKQVAPSRIEDGSAQATANTAGVDPEMEKRVRRKLDLNLIPLVSALYLRRTRACAATSVLLTYCSCFSG